jgi:uncharacterized membrane protein YidH (DUF202 family)
VLSSLSTIAKEVGDGSTALALVATSVILSDVVLSLIAFRVSRRRPEIPRDRWALMCWTVGVGPFLVSVGAVTAGAERWALSVGLAASVALLVVSARELRRDP